jgi:hypothetical protein
MPTHLVQIFEAEHGNALEKHRVKRVRNGNEVRSSHRLCIMYMCVRTCVFVSTGEREEQRKVAREGSINVRDHPSRFGYKKLLID